MMAKSMRFHTIPLLLFSLTAFAGPAIQFCADRPQKVAGGSSGVAAWTSMDGKWSLVPVHTNDIGWCAPSYSARQVRFGICETNTDGGRRPGHGELERRK